MLRKLDKIIALVMVLYLFCMFFNKFIAGITTVFCILLMIRILRDKRIVPIILSVITLIFIPVFKDKIGKHKQELSSAMTELLYDATRMYVSYDENYVKREGNVYCITIDELVKQEL